jgi:hypothetical protein
MGTIYSASICAVVASVSLGVAQADAQNAPIGMVNIGTGSNVGSSVSTVTVTTTFDAPVGSRVVCLAAVANATAINSVADTSGNTWNARNGTTGPTGLRSRLFDAYVTVDMPVGTTITATYNTAGVQAHLAACAVITNLAARAINIDQNVTQTSNTSSTTPSITGTTLALPYEVIISGVAVLTGSGDTYNEASGWTSLSSVSNVSALHLAYQVVLGSTSAPTYAPTLGTARTWEAAMTSYKLMPPSLGSTGAGPY